MPNIARLLGLSSINCSNQLGGCVRAQTLEGKEGGREEEDDVRRNNCSACSNSTEHAVAFYNHAAKKS